MRTPVRLANNDQDSECCKNSPIAQSSTLLSKKWIQILIWGEDPPRNTALHSEQVRRTFLQVRRSESFSVKRSQISKGEWWR